MIDIRKTLWLVLLISTIIISYYMTTNIYSNKHNENNSNKIAVLNGIKLKEKAKCFKLHETNSEKLNNILRIINEHELQIRKDYNIIQNNSKLSSKQKQNKITKLENNWKKIYIHYNKEVQNIKEIDKKLTNYIYEKLNKIIKNTAKEMNINVILNKESTDTIFIFYNNDNLDITDTIILRLDEELKNFDIKDLNNK